MELTRRDLLKGAAALGAAAAVPLTAGGPALAQTTQKKELVTAQSGDVSKFDPHFSTSSNDVRVSFNLFDNLTSRHPDGKLYPGLATEWKLEGQTTWRFKLRQGVKFHNGDPLHLGRREVQHRAHLRSGGQDHGGDRASAPSRRSRRRTPHTLVITTKKPDPLLAARLGLLRRPDRAEEVPRVGGRRHLQRQAGRHAARCASVPGSRTTRRCSRPIRTTGAARSTWTAGSCARSRRPRRASRRCSKGEVDVDHPAAARPGRPRGGQRDHPGGGRALRGPLRARGEQQAAAARQPAREAGPVARDRPRGDREGAVARARRSSRAGPSRRATTTSTRACPRWPTTRRRRRRGSRRRATRARRSSSRPPWPMCRRTRRCRKPSRPCGRTWAST